MAKRFCYALDLKPDSELIAEYDRHHQAVWPEILSLMKASGVKNMQIYRVENRLFLIMDTFDSFEMEHKEAMEKSNPISEQWEQLMWKYQQAIPGTPEGVKWREMKLIFDQSFN
jgi:L-rhamnose mutarotase